MIVGEDTLRMTWFDPARHGADLEALMAECFPGEDWDAKSFKRFINKAGRANTIKLLVSESDDLFGCLLFTSSGDSCRVRRVGVTRLHRRKGLGAHMVHSLSGSRSPVKKKLITARVRESNYPAISMFHKRLGFSFDPKAARDRIGDEDLYVFTFEKARAAEAVPG